MRDAIDAAARGESLPELIERWRQLAKTGGPIEREARSMMWLYQDLVAEKSGNREFTPGEFEKLSAELQAEYWIARLQDQRTTRWGDHPRPFLISPSTRNLDSQLPYEGTPAWHLEQLGWTALPTLIRHMHDQRPTRMRTFFIHGKSTGLMRYGDFCFSVFRAVTLTESADLPEDTHTWATAWWNEHRSDEAAEYYRRLIEGNSLDPVSVSARLLELGKQYLPVLKAAVSKSTTKGRYLIFVRIADRLGPDDQEYVRSFLSEPNSEMVVAAAELLWIRYQSDLGVRELARRLPDAGNEDAEFASRSLWVLGRLCPDSAAEALTALLRRGHHDFLDRTALSSAKEFSYSSVAEAVAADLEVTEAWALADNYWGDRPCDTAAQSLTQLVLYERPFPWCAKVDLRDAFIVELKGWWLAHRLTLDWSAIRHERAERRKRGQ